MFKRYPHWGWLILSVAIGLFNFAHFYAHRQEMLPSEMARTINKSLHKSDDQYNAFVNDRNLVRKLFADSLNAAEVDKIQSFPFYVYTYHGDSLSFWSNNSVIATVNDSLAGDVALRFNAKGIFIRRYFFPDSGNRATKLVVLFPLYISYPIENDYLHSHFVASIHIPVSTKVYSKPTGGSDEYPILMRDNKVAGYLLFQKSDIQAWVPDMLLILLFILGGLCTVKWIQLMILHNWTGCRNFKGVFVLLGVICLLRLAQARFGLPFHLGLLRIFSPSLYASNSFLATLGDLFIFITYALWVIIFIGRHTPYKTFCSKVKSKGPAFALCLFFLSIIVAYAVFFSKVVESLILDSGISFDVTHFYDISIYTGFGLVAIIAVTGISCMIIYMLNLFINNAWPYKWVKYAVFSVLCYSVFTFLHPFHEKYLWYLCSIVLAYIVLIDIPSFTLTSRLFAPHMLVWALIICACCSAMIRYFNELKEQNTRIAFVEQHLAPHRDEMMEFGFYNTAKNIELDKQLKSFFDQPSTGGRKLFDQHFDAQFLNPSLGKYQVKLYLFDSQYNGLYNKDSTSYQSLLNEKADAVVTNSTYLFYKESILDRHYYLSYIPVYSDTVNTIIGHAVILLDVKKDPVGTVYPELLQPVSNKVNLGENEYAYALYINNKLIKQTNDYPFPVWLKNDILKKVDYKFQRENGVSTLYYKISDKRTAVVVHYHGEIIEALTLFSYLFGIQIMIAIIVFIYQLFLNYRISQLVSKRFFRLTLRRKVHLALLTIVFISFTIIGYVTIQFFIKEYRTTNENKFQAAIQVAKQSVQDYLSRKNAFSADYIFDTVSKSPSFKNTLSNIAASQKIDINIYDNDGNLFATSQEEIYDRGLISRKMRPGAFFELNHEGKSLVIQHENVGILSYISAYQPLRNEEGITFGYINIPFFTSEKDLDFQISNIVVTLVNLYAFIFLASSLFTVLVTRGLTRSFDLIIRQFDKLNLEQNERIEWNYDDEIGSLVKEYNKMVKKVEENAVRLGHVPGDTHGLPRHVSAVQRRERATDRRDYERHPGATPPLAVRVLRGGYRRRPSPPARARRSMPGRAA